MTRFGCYSVLAIVLAGLSPAPAAAQTQDAAWFCYSRPGESPIYVSSIWEKREDQDAINAEFRKVLTAKYGYKGGVTCSGATSGANPNAVAAEEKTKASLIAGWQKAGMKIVETGWTGNQPKTPSVTWGVCNAMILAPGGRQNQGPFEMYVSAPLDMGEAQIPAIEAAFEKFLRSKYSISTTDLHPQCLATGDEAQSLAAIKQWTTRGNAQGKTIDTGWKMGK